jgi:cation diffusion facilitator CzcD-associated flavoprotein CzcO
VKPELPLLIIGAGPFGLALAARAAAHGLEYTILGEPMQFWRSNMPKGLLLRSTCDWHLDPMGVHTIDAYLAATGHVCAELEPLSLDLYLDYADWFITHKAIKPRAGRVRRLDSNGAGYVATLDTGETLCAQNVVVAVGLQYFAHVPDELAAVLPAGSYAHTCELVDLDQLRGQRCLIVGGRQSAFEWAALLHEAGACAVDICYRHDTAAFADSDWSWIPPLVDRTRADPSRYRRLPESERQALTQRMWDEGRGRLEPWLKPRIAHESVRLWPRTRVRTAVRSSNGDVSVQLDSGAAITVDQIILATGYRVDMSRIPFLRNGDLWTGLELHDGYPCLDDFLETSHRGLFITGQSAVQAFGPFFGFTAAACASAERIGQALLRKPARQLRR